MASLVSCLVALRSEFNALSPGRDKASDGWIGDAAHQKEKSDHNPDSRGLVHAIDVDNDFNEPDLTMEDVVQFLLARCRSGAEQRLRYIIYNRRIWEADNGWKQRAYNGVSPHTEHAHFSASYDTPLEASTASWHLEDIPVALTADDKKWLTAQIATIAGQVWAEKIGNTARPTRTAKQALNDLSTQRDNEVDPAIGMKGVAAGTPLDRMVKAADVILGQADSK